jgi:hypothetical protein
MSPDGPEERQAEHDSRLDADFDALMVDEENADYDGAPWCQYCGAKSERGCDCGPIASNH